MTRRIYLNQAGTSWPKAPGVVEAVEATLRSDPATYGRSFDEARRRIAATMGIDNPEALLLTPGCTAAIASVLSALPWTPDDIVVTSALEHRAMFAPVEALVRLRGVEHRSIPTTKEGPFDLDALVRVLGTGRVRAVACTAASNVTGERLPVERIVAAARNAGVFVLIDAAQTAGLVHLDLPSLGANAVAFAGHKGPLAPQGIGGLWLASPADPAIGYCDLGSVNLPGAVALASSLEWLASTPIQRRCTPIEQRERLAHALRERPECSVLGTDGPATSAVSFVHDALPVSEAEAYFAARGIVVRAGRHCATRALTHLGVPNGTIRVSFGIFNRDDDVDAVLSAIDDLPKLFVRPSTV